MHDFTLLTITTSRLLGDAIFLQSKGGTTTVAMPIFWCTEFYKSSYTTVLWLSKTTLRLLGTTTGKVQCICVYTVYWCVQTTSYLSNQFVLPHKNSYHKPWLARTHTHTQSMYMHTQKGYTMENAAHWGNLVHFPNTGKLSVGISKY